jgi:hypothetical protein
MPALTALTLARLTLASGITPDNTPHGYNLTFALPVAFFAAVAVTLYLLLGRPHRRIPAAPVPGDPGPADPGPADPGPADPGPADPGPAAAGPGAAEGTGPDAAAGDGQ